MTALESFRRKLQLSTTSKTPLIMGVLNVTPDSFSDGGQFLSVDSALLHAEKMVQEGADILDIGGESTRPSTFGDNAPLPSDEELRRILPVIQGIASRFPETPISVDTYKARVARVAFQAGAVFLNDISALRADPEMPEFVSEVKPPICIMHLLGLPRQIPSDPIYPNNDVFTAVSTHLTQRAELVEALGVLPEEIFLDPGIGFGKNLEQNLTLLRRMGDYDTRYPLLIGTSRKSFIAKLLGDMPPQERVLPTAITTSLATLKNVRMVRVHDVKETKQAIVLTKAIADTWKM